MMGTEHPDRATPSAEREFLQDCLRGLDQRPRGLSPKYFYDARGSRLFERICALPEYYLTRTEVDIMRRHAPEMGRIIGPGALVVEPGSGSGVKIRLLLDALPAPAGYVPVEISPEPLEASVQALERDYPSLDILPVCADFTRPFGIPEGRRPVRRRLAYFPGSTLGNFPPERARELLQRLRLIAGEDGAVLLGVDLEKDPDILVPAYDDAQGVTAAFNRNVLYRMQRELGARLSPEDFAHRAIWNGAEGRMEMHLVSTGHQRIDLGGRCFRFAPGEPIVTEYSYKYTPERLETLASRAGLTTVARWTDPRGWFSVQLLRAG
ncbi:MAG: L-histidine N(alpha)-methyltransferase [Ectothiorhodospiraceae bacterium]|nr:L-histidine N(alpha)-methyltransferase [Ectothiorhodospiraceae bacterium]